MFSDDDCDNGKLVQTQLRFGKSGTIRLRKQWIGGEDW